MNDMSQPQTPAAYLQQLAESKGVLIEDVAQSLKMHWDDVQRLDSKSGVYGTIDFAPLYDVLTMRFDERRQFDQLTYAHWPPRVLPYQITNPEEITPAQAAGTQLLHMIERRGIGMDQVQTWLGIQDNVSGAPPGRLARGKLQGLDGGLSQTDILLLYNHINDVEEVSADERDAFQYEQGHIVQLWHHHALQTETIPEFMRAKFTQRSLSQKEIEQRLDRTPDQMGHAMGGKKPFPYSWISIFDHILHFESDERQHLLNLYKRNHGDASAQKAREAIGGNIAVNTNGFRDEADHHVIKVERPQPIINDQMSLMETLTACGVSNDEFGELFSPRAMIEGQDKGFNPKVLKRKLEQDIRGLPAKSVDAIMAANARRIEEYNRGSGKVGGA